VAVFLYSGTYMWVEPPNQHRFAMWYTAHEFDGSRVQIPGADTVNQAVHPSGVGKLVALSMQWVTAAEDCEV
jgi:hypothetical protein